MATFDCLTREQIEVANHTLTEHEKVGIEFNKSVPRAPTPGISNPLADRLMTEISPLFVERGDALSPQLR